MPELEGLPVRRGDEGHASGVVAKAEPAPTGSSVAEAMSRTTNATTSGGPVHHELVLSSPGERREPRFREIRFKDFRRYVVKSGEKVLPGAIS